MISSDELNYIIWRYLCEGGFENAARLFEKDARVSQLEDVLSKTVPVGALVELVQKGLLYMTVESRVEFLHNNSETTSLIEESNKEMELTDTDLNNNSNNNNDNNNNNNNDNDNFPNSNLKNKNSNEKNNGNNENIIKDNFNLDELHSIAEIWPEISKSIEKRNLGSQYLTDNTQIPYWTNSNERTNIKNLGRDPIYTSFAPIVNNVQNPSSSNSIIKSTNENSQQINYPKFKVSSIEFYPETTNVNFIEADFANGMHFTSSQNLNSNSNSNPNLSSQNQVYLLALGQKASTPQTFAFSTSSNSSSIVKLNTTKSSLFLPGKPADIQVTALAWNESGSLLAIATDDASVRIWNTLFDENSFSNQMSDSSSTCDEKTNIFINSNSPSSANTSSSPDYMKLHAVLSLHKAPVIVFRWRGNTLLSADCSSTIIIWDVSSARVIQIYNNISSLPNSSIPFHPSNEDLIHLISQVLPSSNSESNSLSTSTAYSYISAILPIDCVWIDTSMFASSTSNGSIVLYKLSDRTPVRVLRAHPGYSISALAYSPISEVIISAGSEGKVKVWKSSSSDPSRTLVHYDKNFRSKNLATRNGSYNEHKANSRISTSTKISSNNLINDDQNLINNDDNIQSNNNFKRNKRRSSIISNDNNMYDNEYEKDNDSHRNNFNNNFNENDYNNKNSNLASPITVVKFCPANVSIIAVANLSGTVVLWDYEKGVELQVFNHFKLPVFAMEFSSCFVKDKFYLAAGDRSGELAIWEGSSGANLVQVNLSSQIDEESLRNIDGSADETTKKPSNSNNLRTISSISWTSDGKYLAACTNKKLCILDVQNL